MRIDCHEGKERHGPQSDACAPHHPERPDPEFEGSVRIGLLEHRHAGRQRVSSHDEARRNSTCQADDRSDRSGARSSAAAERKPTHTMRLAVRVAGRQPLSCPTTSSFNAWSCTIGNSPEMCRGIPRRGGLPPARLPRPLNLRLRRSRHVSESNDWGTAIRPPFPSAGISRVASAVARGSAASSQRVDRC